MEKITTANLQVSKSPPSLKLRRASKRQKITMLTAYDYPFAKILDSAGTDIILVGDSLGNVALGYRNTLPVTMQEMIIHTKAVSRAVKRSMVIADMPFGSFQKDSKEALSNAIKLVKAGAEGVKIEGIEYLEAIKKIIKAGIPVIGHLGLTPQSVYKLGGYAKQGKDRKTAQKILKDAKALERAGCFAIVLEMIPDGLAKKISRSLEIPTIGIGAGPFCDGQVLVTADLVGLSDWSPSFAKKYINLKDLISKTVKKYIRDVQFKRL
jgi:3-methyl-2-oxobutanoate hydroxymethyltransferase